MSRPQSGPPVEADLRVRILSASIALVESQGLAALSMREVARRAGVSHQAPYHHFQDREAILAALVAQGFDDLAARLGVARERSSRASDALFAVGMAYVRFALDRPGMYRILFRPELVDHRRFPAADAAGDRAFAELERLVETVFGPGAQHAHAAMHWSLVHGLATLLIDGKLGAMLKSRRAREAHAKQVLRLFVEVVAGGHAPGSRAAPR